MSTPEPLPPPAREHKLDTEPRVDAVSTSDLRTLREEVFAVLNDLTIGAQTGFANTDDALRQQELAMAQMEARLSNQIADLAKIIAAPRDQSRPDPTTTTITPSARRVN